MNRRRLLTALATGTASVLAGCSATGSGESGAEASTQGGGDATRTESPSRPTSTRTDARNAAETGGTATPAGSSLARQGVPSTICEAGIEPGGIRAIVDPAFAADWSGVDVDERYRGDTTADGPLGAEDVVIGVERGGDARAYPLSVVWWHEVVNDAFRGPLLVTYCPICRSGMVAERRVGGEPTVFGVTGQLWQAPAIRTGAAVDANRSFGAAVDDAGAAVRNSGNLVLYDEATRSYWSQVLATAICGPRAGDDLRVAPSAVATWSEWRTDHPGTDVLLPPPYSGLL